MSLPTHTAVPDSHAQLDIKGRLVVDPSHQHLAVVAGSGKGGFLGRNGWLSRFSLGNTDTRSGVSIHPSGQRIASFWRTTRMGTITLFDREGKKEGEVHVEIQGEKDASPAIAFDHEGRLHAAVPDGNRKLVRLLRWKEDFSDVQKHTVSVSRHLGMAEVLLNPPFGGLIFRVPLAIRSGAAQHVHVDSDAEGKLRAETLNLAGDTPSLFFSPDGGEVLEVDAFKAQLRRRRFPGMEVLGEAEWPVFENLWASEEEMSRVPMVSFVEPGRALVAIGDHLLQIHTRSMAFEAEVKLDRAGGGLARNLGELLLVGGDLVATSGVWQEHIAFFPLSEFSR